MNLKLINLIFILLLPPLASAYKLADPKYQMRLRYHDYIRKFGESGLRSQDNQCKKRTSCQCKTTIYGFFYQCDPSLYAECNRYKSVLYIYCNQTVRREDVMDHILHLSEVAADSPVRLYLYDCPPDAVSDFRYPDKIKALILNCAQRKDFILAPDQFRNLSRMETLRISCFSLRNLPQTIFKRTKFMLSTIQIEGTMIERLGNGLLSNLSALEYIHFVKNEKLSLQKSDFIGLHSLRLLEINGFHSKEIDDDLFEPISNISRLLISESGWKSLPRSFSQLHLDYLKISDTSLEWMGDDFCRQQIDMNAILILRNPFLDIHPDCIILYNTSEIIDLSGNRISSLPNRTILLNRLWKFQFNDNGLDIKTVKNFMHSNTLLDLGMRNSSIQSIHKDFFRGISNVRRVDLCDNKLIYLPDGVFESNEKLEIVSLRGNKLTSIPKSSLNIKPLLFTIDVSHNNISEIDFNVTQNLSSLAHLDLSHNKLTHIPRNPFSSMPSITYFDISNNNISQIDTIALQTMSNLKTLRMRGNVMIGKFFPHPQKFEFLTNLSAESNSFIEISWLNIPSLHELNLSNNLIEKLDLRVFDSCTNLSTLNLSRNRIEVLPRQIFSKHLKNLTSLDLSFNRLKFLPDYINLGIRRGIDINVTIFYNLKLDILDLSGNPMERFDLNWLGDSKSLRKVFIRSGNISRLNSKRMEIVHVLVMDLSRNKISSKNWPWYYDEWLKSSGKLSSFVDMTYLEELYLGHNEITDIPLDFRIHNPNLKILDLSYNKIKHLTYQELLFSSYNLDAYGNAEPLEICSSLTVDLTNNLIRSIDFPHTMLTRNVTTKCEKHKYSHATILLGNNPFECGCKVIPFLRVVEEDVVLTSELWRSKGKSWLLQARIDASNLSCRYPESVNGKLVVSTDTWMHHLLPMMGFCYLSEDKDVIDTK